MTDKKRGLSRGLEALLKIEPKAVDIDALSHDDRVISEQLKRLLERQNTPTWPAPPGAADSGSLAYGRAGVEASLVLELFEHIRKENMNLLEEAEALKSLIDEFEQMLKRFADGLEGSGSDNS
ncbi:MAG: hypothetical protein ACU84J_06560 [Gammaproteobacteria bacterium]